MFLQPPSRPIHLQQSTARTAATYDEVLLPQVPGTMRHHITSVAAWNETTHVVLTCVFIKVRTRYFPIAEIQQDDNTSPHSKMVDIWLDEYEELAFRFYDGSEGDVLHCYASGEEV